MLLRSITKHVREQNWFAVGLDFFIVVVGILIAFQISNWNTARNNSERAHEALVSILEDIKNDRSSLRTGLSFAQTNIDASNFALIQSGLKGVDTLTMPWGEVPALGGSEYELGSSLKTDVSMSTQLWKQASVRYHPNPSDAAFTSLIAAGELSLIKDADLIRELQRYGQLWVGLENANESTYRPFRDRLVFVGQDYGLSPFSDVENAELIALLEQNPRLASTLRTMLEYSVLHREQIEQVDRLAKVLIERLEGELK